MIKIKQHIELKFSDSSEITEFYRSLRVDYPKFFKMDNLSKLGFVASEMLLKDAENRFEPREDIAVICFNRSSSLETDTQYEATIARNDNYFPSPSLFVYTLPNIVMGEIAIRNKFFGETSFYILENYDFEKIMQIVENTFSDKTINEALVAWIECFENIFEVKMFLVERGGFWSFIKIIFLKNLKNSLSLQRFAHLIHLCIKWKIFNLPISNY